MSTITKTAGYLLILLLVPVWIPTAGAQARYTFESLDVPQATTTSPFGLNNSGQIVGSYDDSTGHHGFVFSRGAFQTVDYPSAAATELHGISENGAIVGGYWVCFVYGCYHSFVFKDGVFTVLPDAPGSKPGTTVAWSINSSGQIVGSYVDSCFCTTHGFVYADGLYSTVDVPGYFSTSVQAVNNSGQTAVISEYGWGDGHPYGYVLRHGEFSAASAAPRFGLLSAINESGELAGWVSQGRTAPAIFVVSKGVTTIVTYPGSLSSAMFGPGLNASGQLVGVYEDSSRQVHGFIASRANGRSGR